MRTRCVLLCLATAACAGDGTAPLWGDRPVEPLDLRAELSAAEVQLLGEVRLTLDLYVGAGLEVEFAPAVPDGFRGRVEAAEPRPTGAGEWRRFELWLRPTRPGELELPAFRAQAGEDGPVATSPELRLQVTSVLHGAGAEVGAEVEAPAPPFPPAAEPGPWIAAGIGALALLALVWWWRRRRRAPAEVQGTPVPAHVRALRALGRLRQAPRSTRAQVEEFYVEVSHILRVYLEERFGLHAPERTTEEFLAEVEAGDALSAEQRASLRQFLQQCDLVKFARALPDEAVHASTFGTAEQFVEATREDRIREGAA